MASTRRSFIKQSSLLAFGAAALPKIQPPAPMLAGDPATESYWETLRAQFSLDPALTYLNNASLGPSPQSVVQATLSTLHEIETKMAYGNWEQTTATLARFAGAAADEIALTHHTTEGINIMCWGAPLKAGDEVIMTTHEHAGNALPWLNRQKIDRIVLKTFTPEPTAEGVLKQLEQLVTKRTKVIAVPHVLCSHGQVLPVADICAFARNKGILTLIDGAHGVGMIPLNLHQMGCDAYATCGHKWLLGPKGTGFLYVRKASQELITPRFVGGGSDDGNWNMNISQPQLTAYHDSAHRYYGGTHNLALFKGLAAAVDFHEHIGTDQVHQRILFLGSYLRNALATVPGITLHTPEQRKSYTGIIGFTLAQQRATEVYAKLSAQHIRIRLFPENGLNYLRASAHIYNTTADIDRLVAALKTG